MVVLDDAKRIQEMRVESIKTPGATPIPKPPTSADVRLNAAPSKQQQYQHTSYGQCSQGHGPVKNQTQETD